MKEARQKSHDELMAETLGISVDEVEQSYIESKRAINSYLAVLKAGIDVAIDEVVDQYLDDIINQKTIQTTFTDGTKLHLKDRLLHSNTGPAIEGSNGQKVWYFEGLKLPCSSQEEFEQLMKLKLFW
jgi:urease gamma subunit